MDIPYHSTFNPFSPQFEAPQTSISCFTQFQPQDNDVLIPSLLVSQQQDHLDNLLLTIPSFPVADVFLQGSDNNNNNVNNLNDPKKKQKIVHREIERQRRSEMSSLHASLRTLLPHEYIRGKRAMSDHLGEAVKYIKHLQQNINALNKQRDALKKEKCVNNNSKPGDHEVKVTTSKGGVNVTVSTSCRVEGSNNNVNVDDGCSGIALSKVLQCLNQEGFDVVSCISQRLGNSKLLHCIQAQVEDGRIIATDAVKLQQKLEDL
ncbi:hypothetical protein KSS87_011127 [Heliosperma pusillum]|nr:hypothetical protein KSS87_011127 [Heliosperma pusillum]